VTTAERQQFNQLMRFKETDPCSPYNDEIVKSKKRQKFSAIGLIFSIKHDILHKGGAVYGQ
jgi:hypothetical protein